jgi:methanogenic corrinoid protein MtbC1
MAALPAVRDDFLAALLAGDGTRARYLVEAALDAGVTVEEVYLDVLGPALAEVGELWERGRLSVGYEHFATSVAQRVVGAIGPRIRRPPAGGRLAVLACVPGEQHSIGLLMAGDFLEAEAWEVLQLGAGMPAEDLAGLVANEQPDVVGLSMATVGRVEEARETLDALDALSPRPFVVIGGRACLELAPAELEGMGADACLAGPRELVALVTERFPPLPDDA